MTTIMNKFWWAIMLRGVLAIAFGAGVFFCQSVSSLGYLFGTFALAQGVLSGSPAFTAAPKGTFLAGIEGAVGVLVALLTLLGSSIGTLLWPSVSNFTILIYAIFWILVTGLIALAMLVRFRGENAAFWYTVLNAVLCLIFGILLVYRRAAGALGNAWILAIFAILYGVALVVIGRKAQCKKS